MGRCLRLSRNCGNSASLKKYIREELSDSNADAESHPGKGRDDSTLVAKGELTGSSNLQLNARRRIDGIETIRLDSWVSEYDDPSDRVKMNTEGAGYAGAKGVFKAVKSDRVCVLMRGFWSGGRRSRVSYAEADLRLALRRGFRVFGGDELQGRIVLAGIAGREDKYSRARLDCTNLPSVMGNGCRA